MTCELSFSCSLVGMRFYGHQIKKTPLAYAWQINIPLNLV